MTAFDERERGYEALFLHNQELAFRAQNRRNKLLGLWAAELMGLEGDDAAAYARTVVEEDFVKVGDDDVHDKVYADLRAHHVDLSDHRLRRKMDELMVLARRQIAEEA